MNSQDELLRDWRSPIPVLPHRKYYTAVVVRVVHRCERPVYCLGRIVITGVIKGRPNISRAFIKILRVNLRVREGTFPSADFGYIKSRILLPRAISVLRGFLIAAGPR